MSKNAKNARKIREAKQRNRAKGYKGAAKTKCLHNKNNAWYRVGDNNNSHQRRKKNED